MISGAISIYSNTIKVKRACFLNLWFCIAQLDSGCIISKKILS